MGVNIIVGTIIVVLVIGCFIVSLFSCICISMDKAESKDWKKHDINRVK